MHWLTIEVFDAATPASEWQRAWHDLLVEAALTAGAAFWDDHEHSWGVVLEFTFASEPARDRFRDGLTVRAALDAAPDPVSGVLVYPHRGGGAGARMPRHPLAPAGTGALQRPEPDVMEPCAVIAVPTVQPVVATSATEPT